MNARAIAALAAAIALVLLGCAGDEDSTTKATPTPEQKVEPAGTMPPPPNPDLLDLEAGVRFALDGRVLTVRLLASARNKTRRRASGARLRATCGASFAEAPGPGPGPDRRQTRTRLWPAGRNQVRYRFRGDISLIARWCRLEDPVVGHVAFVKFR